LKLVKEIEILEAKDQQICIIHCNGEFDVQIENEQDQDKKCTSAITFPDTENNKARIENVKIILEELNKTNCPYQSPELKKNLIFTKKTDIYALGAVFHRLCYCTFPSTFGEIKNKNYYPKEMGDIIQMMINQDENARPDTEKLYSLIMEEYIKNVTRISSIDSIFRCMCSFKNFTNYMYKNIGTYSNSNTTPISFDLVNCLQNYFCGMILNNYTEYKIEFCLYSIDSYKIYNLQYIHEIKIIDKNYH